MYNKVPVETLSETQQSRARNGHGVRVKYHPQGRHHIMMSHQQTKKVISAAHKGKGATLILDPYQQTHHRVNGHGVGKMLKKAFRNPAVKGAMKQIGHMGLAAAGAYGQANGLITPDQAHLLESVGHNAIESKSAAVKNILKNEALHLAEQHGFDPNAPAADYSKFYEEGQGLRRRRRTVGGKINHKALRGATNFGKQMLHGAVTYGMTGLGDYLGGPLGGIAGNVASNYVNDELTKAGAGLRRRRRRGGALMPAGY